VNNPLVSIVIPVYNGSNYLREAIDSALSQTYLNREVIVVNDGSNDGTEDVCLSYGDKIRYFHKENGGVASAINLGIQKMRGEYFSWLSHDDIYYPEKTEYQIKALESNNDSKGIVIGNFDFFNMRNGAKTLFDMEKRCDPLKLTKGIYPALFGLVHACVMLVHCDNIDRVGTLNEKLLTTQDIDWIFRLLRGKDSIFIKKPLIGVRLHDEQGKHHIKCFSAEQSETHISFLNSITKDEIIQLFDSEYMFYYQVASFYKRDKNWRAYEYAKQLFNKSTIPDEFSESSSMPLRLID